MRPLLALMIFLVVIFVGGALVAPWLFWLAQGSAGINPSVQKLAAQPFHRYVNRSILVLALAGLWPFLRALGARSWRDIGLCGPAGQWTRLAGGLGLGFSSLACVALLTILAGARTLDLDHSTARTLQRLLSAGLAAVAAGTLEEIIFRGALFGTLKKAHGWITAMLVSSAVYALLHFFERPASPETVNWTSGFVVFGQMLCGFVDVDRLVPGFFVLMLAGMLLALAYQRTGNLYFSIGLHAGWIFWLQSYNFLTNSTGGANAAFWGSVRLIDGWLAFLVLLLALLIVVRLPVPRKPNPTA